MANPLIRKNPLSSLARCGGRHPAASMRPVAKPTAPRAQTQLTDKAVRVWTQTLFAPAKPKKKRQD